MAGKQDAALPVPAAAPSPAPVPVVLAEQVRVKGMKFQNVSDRGQSPLP